jgi:hypothetical protein
MKIINIANLKEGMVIAEDIYTLDNKLLVEEGKITNSRLKLQLMNEGINKIKVYTTEDNKEINKIKLLKKYNIDNINELTKIITDNLKKRFSRVMDSKLMRDILYKTIDYELKSLGIDK